MFYLMQKHDLNMSIHLRGIHLKCAPLIEIICLLCVLVQWDLLKSQDVYNCSCTLDMFILNDAKLIVSVHFNTRQ